ncbi:MAG: hypothetical protein WCW44_06525 [archaeon]|jgi:hypothetical protein
MKTQQAQRKKQGPVKRVVQQPALLARLIRKHRILKAIKASPLVAEIRRNQALKTKKPLPEGARLQVAKLFSGVSPFSPNVIIELGQHRLAADAKTITHPERFDHHFKKGERILYTHVESTDPRVIMKLSKFMTTGETAKMLHEAGFAGIVGDTPTQTLVKMYLKMGFRAVEAPLPKAVRVRERIRYAKNVQIRGYPREFLRSPIKRVTFRFDGATLK